MARSDEVLQALKEARDAIAVDASGDFEHLHKAAAALDDLSADDFEDGMNKQILSALAGDLQNIETGCYGLVDVEVMGNRLKTLIARVGSGRE